MDGLLERVLGLAVWRERGRLVAVIREKDGPATGRWLKGNIRGVPVGVHVGGLRDWSWSQIGLEFVGE